MSSALVRLSALWLACVLSACSSGRSGLDAAAPHDGGPNDHDGGTGDACAQRSCEEVSASCGQIPDGCGGMLDCGACSAGDTCGGAGTPNVCGLGPCAPRSCALQGKNCGVVSDGCSQSLDCGSCPTPQICGGGGANVCGLAACIPLTCAALSASCGVVSDGCGGTLACGACATGQTCGAGLVPDACSMPCPDGCPTGYSCGDDGVCAGGTPSVIALDVMAPTVSGTVTLNGAAPIDGAGCTSGTFTKAYLVFTETTLGYSLEVPIPCSAVTYAFSTALPLGTYSVTVTGLASYTNLPTTASVANPALAVTASVPSLALDVKAFSLAGVVTLNGGAPMDCPSGSYAGLTKAIVTFTDTSTKTATQLAMTCGVPGYAFAGMIQPGTYRVDVAGEAPNTSLPASALVSPAYVVSAAVPSLALDVKTFMVSGTITLDGAAPSSCPAAGPLTAQKALITFTDTTLNGSNTVALPCSQSDFSFSTMLPAGTYRVTAGGTSGISYSTLPGGTYLVKPSLAVSAAVANLTLDVKPVAIAGTLTLGGVAPTDGSSCATSPTLNKAFVLFTSATDSFQFVVPCTSPTYAFSGMVPPGVYKVEVVGQGAALTNIPTVEYVANAALPIASAQPNLVVDEPALLAVGGNVTLNGATPVDGTLCAGNPTLNKVSVSFTQQSTGNEFLFYVPCSATTYAFSGQVPPGTYEVQVNGLSSVYTNIPYTAAGYVVNPSLSITSAQAALSFDVKATTVTGTVSLNGALPIDGSICTSLPTLPKAYVSFTEKTLGYAFELTVPCSSATYTYTGVVYNGTYEVTASSSSSTYSSLPATSSVASSEIQIP